MLLLCNRRWRSNAMTTMRFRPRMLVKSFFLVLVLVFTYRMGRGVMESSRESRWSDEVRRVQHANEPHGKLPNFDENEVHESHETNVAKENDEEEKQGGIIKADGENPLHARHNHKLPDRMLEPPSAAVQQQQQQQQQRRDDVEEVGARVENKHEDGVGNRIADKNIDPQRLKSDEIALMNEPRKQEQEQLDQEEEGQQQQEQHQQKHQLQQEHQEQHNQQEHQQQHDQQEYQQQHDQQEHQQQHDQQEHQQQHDQQEHQQQHDQQEHQQQHDQQEQQQHEQHNQQQHQEQHRQHPHQKQHRQHQLQQQQHQHRHSEQEHIADHDIRLSNKDINPIAQRRQEDDVEAPGKLSESKQKELIRDGGINPGRPRIRHQDAAVDAGVNEVHADMKEKDESMEKIIFDMDVLAKNIVTPAIPLDPKDRPGEMGKPVLIEPELKAQANALYGKNAFNLMASNRIALNRSLPDKRFNECRTIEYPESLPTTSVIVIFHNEAFSTLLRTVYSVLTRSPPRLLQEIILVDDASDQDHLKSPLDEYIRTHFEPSKVRLERMFPRSGLIQARMRGAVVAKGTVLTFLDSHCEATQGWLEPLLAQIAKDRRNVVTPVIDSVSAEDFGYGGGDYLPQVGSFSWDLVFRWTMIQSVDLPAAEADRTLPIRSPTMAGGLFAIDKSFFSELGMYDPAFKIWGGENIELSFKSWMCGGTLTVMPCSRVGHVFRKFSPYKGGGNTLVTNTKRLVEVWLGKHKAFYYSINPMSRNLSPGDISERVALRDHLQCKSFDWYLENVFPESHWPRNGSIFGRVENKHHRVCLNKLGTEKFDSRPCAPHRSNMLWTYTAHEEIRNNELCLDSTGMGKVVSLYRCHKSKGNQQWRWDNTTKLLRHGSHSGCLTIANDPAIKSINHPRNLVLEPCSEANTRQKWNMPPLYRVGADF